MSILIKGMKMPKNCDECNFSLDCPHDQHRDGYKMIGSRPNSCPMVEVPTPHGRLIDADCCNDYFYEHMSDDMMIAAMNAINEMPTIIESESEK